MGSKLSATLPHGRSGALSFLPLLPPVNDRVYEQFTSVHVKADTLETPDRWSTCSTSFTAITVSSARNISRLTG